MRHAVLIMAHKDVPHVFRLAQYFKRNCDLFIHFDKRSSLTEDNASALCGLPQVKRLFCDHTVCWGGTSVLECELHLLSRALDESEADYYHLISGQDYPIRPLDQFLQFFEDNKGREYIQYSHLPNPRWESNTFRRFEYFYPYDWAEERKRPRRWVMEQVHKQMEQGMKRPLPTEFDHLYGGSQWFSITRKAAETLVEYTKSKPSFYRRMWMTFAPEETYVPTVLLNLLDKETITAANLRFIRWQNENGNRPANLGMEHFFRLVENECFFARKFEHGISERLIENIDQYLLKDESVKLMPCGGWEYDGFLSYGYDDVFCRFVTQFCQELGIVSAVDLGCGAGIYVSKWHEFNLAFEGYDANPHTPRLSQLLMPEAIHVCGFYDLTGDRSLAKTYEVVVCKDVLPYIPGSKLQKAADNISWASSHFIILSWNVEKPDEEKSQTAISDERIRKLFATGFEVENYMTARLRVMLFRRNCCVLIRKGRQILDETGGLI